MRNFSIVAIFAGVGFASIGHAVAAGGMGDVAAHMRYDQLICDEQRRGEYPRNFNACLPDYPPRLFRQARSALRLGGPPTAGGVRRKFGIGDHASLWNFVSIYQNKCYPRFS